MRQPDMSGSAGSAWFCRAPKETPDEETGILAYLVNSYRYHPFWSWWIVSLASLYDMPGVTPANKVYPEAEYELMIVSLDPEGYPPDPDNGPYKYLLPLDLVYQFDLLGTGRSDDEIARRITIDAVKAIIHGRMSPDQDYRRRWESLLGRMLARYQEAKH